MNMTLNQIFALIAVFFFILGAYAMDTYRTSTIQALETQLADKERRVASLEHTLELWAIMEAAPEQE